MKEFAASVVADYNINSNCVRVAITRYNELLAMSSVLTLHNNRSALQAYIRELGLLNGRRSPRLDNALRELRANVFSSTVVRPGATLIAVIVTDNLQPSTKLTNQANLAKSRGITIVAVGITRRGRVDTTTLYAVASRNGSTTYATTVTDYSRLSGAVSVTLPWRCLIRPAPPAGRLTCSFITAQCTLVQSAVLRSHVVRPSVRL